MPKGLKRYYGTGDLHFITCSCYKRRPWLNTERRRNLFLNILEEVRKQHRFVVLGYVVMPEHFHLLMSEPQLGDPSTAMQSVKQRFAQRVMPRHRRRNPVQHGDPQPMPIWQPRFYDFNVWTERKRIEKLRYMHCNPVKRGLVKDPEQWLWSSFRYHKYREAGLVGVNDCSILRIRLRESAT
jgi:putative transposase